MPFPLINDHVLLPYRLRVVEADTRFAALLTEDRLRAIVDLIPDVWGKMDGKRAGGRVTREDFAAWKRSLANQTESGG